MLYKIAVGDDFFCLLFAIVVIVGNHHVGVFGVGFRLWIIRRGGRMKSCENSGVDVWKIIGFFFV